MVLLSVTEIHAVKTLNSELRSNSQLSACILYGRKNDLPREVISSKGIVDVFREFVGIPTTRRRYFARGRKIVGG